MLAGVGLRILCTSLFVLICTSPGNAGQHVTQLLLLHAICAATRFGSDLLTPILYFVFCSENSGAYAGRLKIGTKRCILLVE